MLEKIVIIHLDLRKHWVDESGELKAHVHIFIQGRNVHGLLSGLDSVVENSDTLVFFLAHGGGLKTIS